jgi:cyclopropane fatty-acyl-phospholipid synthase-like methyltransferase
MLVSPDNRDVTEEFAERYGTAQPDVALKIESNVLGGRWGANGYTTMVQADMLATQAQLDPSTRVLDVGAGRGWPGLYLATTGCEVVLVDVPLAALLTGSQRLAAEGLTRRASVAAGSVTGLPFRSASFDAVVHADVMCCLRPKITALRECLRVLRPGGVTAFFVIHLSPGVTHSQRRRAIRDGPTFVTSSHSYPEMLEAAGFTDIRETDYTASYGDTARAWGEQRERFEKELTDAIGGAAFEERQADGRAKVRAIEDGILHRALLTARRPSRD